MRPEAEAPLVAADEFARFRGLVWGICVAYRIIWPVCGFRLTTVCGPLASGSGAIRYALCAQTEKGQPVSTPR